MQFVDETLVGIGVKLPYIEYWNEVQIATGEDRPEYDILPILLFSCNLEIERASSVETDVHRNPKRNRISQEIFHINKQIRFGEESEFDFDKLSWEQCFLLERYHSGMAPKHLSLNIWI